MKNSVKLSTVMLITLLSLCSCNNNNKKPEEPVTPDVPTNPAIEVEDGRVKEKYGFTRISSTYNNRDSAISRFTVYVETDYDTDLDGKNDLVKVFVQVPREVLEKGYKVANIIQASPYTAGVIEEDNFVSYMSDESISHDEINKAGNKREVTPKVDVLEHSDNCALSNFYYILGNSRNYQDMEDCDYFLVRGFAFINVGGYGTYDSEGLQTQGSRLETHAFASTIEWLNGTRVAFTDKEGTNTIEASFSNGNSAVQGTSYLGTTAYQLAGSNIPGLKTVCPTAGIASWYEYTNNQGVSTGVVTNTPWLSHYCSSRIYENNASFTSVYSKYLRYLFEEELASGGDYNDYWLERDYTKNINLSCPALIVHGLNDQNVKIKHGIHMYNEFKKANLPVKMIMHQGSHVSYASSYYAFSIDEYKESFYEVLNRWYSHYLYDVDNGIENYPEITYQSNVDGKYYQMDNFTDFQYEDMVIDATPTRTTVTSLNSKYMYPSFKDEYYSYGGNNVALFDLGTLDEDLFIKGSIQLDIDLKTTDIGRNNLPVTAVLLDCSNSYFDTYGTVDFQTIYKVHSGTRFNYINGTMGTYTENGINRAKFKAISTSSFDLYNPGTAPEKGSGPRVELESDETYHYNVHFSPTIYTAQKGHYLTLALYTFDPAGLVKEGYTGETKDYPFKTREFMLKPMAWSTTDPYSYTIDLTDKPVLHIPH